MKRTTEKAILVVLRPSGREVWIPRSVIAEEGDVNCESSVNDTGEMFVEEWFAKKEGLTEDET